MRHRGTETDFELTTIERLEALGYPNRDVRAEDFDRFVSAIMEQAEALYANWPFVLMRRRRDRRTSVPDPRCGEWRPDPVC